MDCFSVESEFIESLDFLSPPVRRIGSSRQAFGSTYNTDGNDVHLLRGLRNRFADLAPAGFSKPTNAVKNSESSTSLVLKKTSDREILGHQHSFVSFASVHKPERDISTVLKSEKKPSEKPLIKVTVIPKTDQVQAAKLLRRRRYMPKKVQSTTSNHENSIQTKNVYLIVAGRRREKVYEIKTTGSAKFSTDHDSNSNNDETPIKQLTNFKQLIQSLNMDKKKKKQKKPLIVAEAAEAPPIVEWNSYQKCNNNCICVDEPRDRQAPKKSRVRIFGQFGISEEDKYVLRYGATVDDKTVLSDVAQLTRDFSPILPDASYDTNEEQLSHQQSSGLQGDYSYRLNNERPVIDTLSKESQGTQVNFNVDVVAAKARAATFLDKKIQCSCYGNRSDQNTLKDCQSPMVIISVYPKQNPEDTMQSVPAVSAQRTSPTGVKTFASNHVLKTEKSPTKTDTKRNFKSPRVSRSPSPARKASKPKVPDNSVKVPVSEKKSPDRQKALRAIKEKIREKDKLKQDASSRKVPPKSNTTNATQVSKNQQNLTVSNTTQVSKKSERLNTASQATQMTNENYQNPNTSNGTQASAKIITNYTASSGTQYSYEAESFSASTQCEDTLNSLHEMAPIKHSINDATISKRFPQPLYSPVRHLNAQVSNATQVPKQLQSSQSTQVSKSNDPILTISCATQVTKDPKVPLRIGKNQETSTTRPAHGFKSEQTSRFIPKAKAESGTNTDHAETKKALVETYTKKLTEEMIQNDYLPARFDNSKVRVNIDGDREYYDVLFNQDTMTTDLRVRKTLKDMDSQKFLNEAELGSLLCFPGKCNAARQTLPDSTVKRGRFNSGNKSPTRSQSIAVGKNPSEEDQLMKHVSRITIRDSLEISHRHADRSNNNLKNTQTCFTAQLANEVLQGTEYLGAPMKHFTGDDCSLCDPVERDRQIRELLGVDKVKSSHSKTSQNRFCENDAGIPYQYIYRKKCQESQVTEINYEFSKLCPCFKPAKKKQVTVSVQCRQGTCQSGGQKPTPENCPDQCYVNYSADGNTKQDDKTAAVYQQLILNRNIQVFLQVEQFSKQKPIVLSRQQYDKVKKTIQKTICAKKSSQGKRRTLVSKRESSEISIGEVRTKRVKEFVPLQKMDTQQDTFEKTANDYTPPQQQAEETSPTTTDTTQESVHEVAAQTYATSCNKKTCKHLHKSERKAKSRKETAKIDMKGDYSSDDMPTICSDYSEEEKVKKSKKDKKKDKKKHSSDDMPTKCSDNSDEEKVKKSKKDKKKDKKKHSSDDMPTKCSDNSDEEKVKKSKKDKKKKGAEVKTIFKPRPGVIIEQDVAVGGKDGSVKRSQTSKIDKGCSVCCLCDEGEQKEKEQQLTTYVLFNAETSRANKDAKEAKDAHTRRTMSSVEVHYASVAFRKQVAYSSTDVGAMSNTSLGPLNSFQTLFRGHRRCATPNLGTSAYSLYSEEGYHSENKCAKLEPQDLKPKKPFLRRLMSCLVMRSARESQLKLPIGPPPVLPSVNSSIDSYHISTSLGAVEVSSSIYDTSASFYSNHTIFPINNKIKRGFFSSVRGFLTNRKS